MAGTALPKSGLQISQDGDVDWYKDLRDGQQAFESRLGLSFNGDPNKNVAGSWYGQSCIDTLNQAIYFCVKPGAAIDTIWVSQTDDPTPPGKVDWFFRTALPIGWLPMDGQVRLKADFPRLHAVLPDSIKTGVTFTLPAVSETLAPLFGGAGNIGTIVGANTTGNGGAIPASDITANVPVNPNDSGEIGYASSGYINSSSGGTPHIQYIANILAQKVKIPAVNAHNHSTSTRGMLFIAGVKF